MRDSVEVKLFAEDGELYVLAKSEGGRAKERAIRRRKLRAMRRSCPARDQLLLRIGAAKKEAGRAYGFVRIGLPKDGAAVTRQSFTFAVDKDKLRKAELRDGHYLLRSNLAGEDPAVLWDRYVQLTQVEAAFKTMKSELGLKKVSLVSRRGKAGERGRRIAAKVMKPLGELNPGGLAGQLLYWVLIRMPRKCFGAAGLLAAGECTKALAADVLLPLWMEVRR